MTSDTSLPLGNVASFESGPIPLFVRRPTSAPRGVLISVHGNMRQAAVHALRFAELAERHGLLLVAPSFARAGHRRFQRLEQGADTALTDSMERLLTALGLPAHDDAFARWCMFGHSAGAQFVHRFLYRQPQRVRRAALSAAGWYTLPNHDAAYPYGLGAAPGAPMPVHADMRAVLAVPQRVFVGDQDVRSGDALRREDALDAQQGANRLERARTYVRAMRAAARAHGVVPAVSLRELPGAAHDFDTNMRRTRLGRMVLRFLLADAATTIHHEESDDVEQAAAQRAGQSADIVSEGGDRAAHRPCGGRVPCAVGGG